MALIRPSSFLRDANPRGLISDFLAVWRQADRHRWRFAALAAACTIAVFSVMWQQEARGLPPPPKITYITDWTTHRTNAQIMASNIANQKRKERLAAEQAKRDEEVRKIYMSLGRMAGMDVDAIAKKDDAERAAEERADRKRFGVPPSQKVSPRSE